MGERRAVRDSDRLPAEPGTCVLDFWTAVQSRPAFRISSCRALVLAGAAGPQPDGQIHEAVGRSMPRARFLGTTRFSRTNCRRRYHQSAIAWIARCGRPAWENRALFPAASISPVCAPLRLVHCFLNWYLQRLRSIPTATQMILTLFGGHERRGPTLRAEPTRRCGESTAKGSVLAACTRAAQIS